jgi:hypothetical protein
VPARKNCDVLLLLPPTLEALNTISPELLNKEVQPQDVVVTVSWGGRGAECETALSPGPIRYGCDRVNKGFRE